MDSCDRKSSKQLKKINFFSYSQQCIHNTPLLLVTTYIVHALLPISMTGTGNLERERASFDTLKNSLRRPALLTMSLLRRKGEEEGARRDERRQERNKDRRKEKGRHGEMRE